MNSQQSPIKILLVEDNPGDVRLTQEALKRSRSTAQLHIVSDGEEALQFLRRKKQYTDAVRPHLILLDLNLPKLSGLEVLAEVKTDSNLRKIPVVVLTTSEDEKDVLGSYDRFASSYLVKPVSFDQFIRVTDSFREYWLNIVKYPPL